MKTNQLKKGASVMLRNGWKAELVDNMRGNTRLAKVYGDYTEIGSIYAHNIVKYKIGDDWHDDIVHTKSQKELIAFERWQTAAHLVSGENFAKQIWLAACEYKEAETKDLLRKIKRGKNE